MLTDEVKQKIKELAQSGKKAKEIAQELKVSIGTVYRVLKGEREKKPEQPQPLQPAQTQPQSTETQILKETISDLKVNGDSKKESPSEPKKEPKKELKPKLKEKESRNQLIWVLSLLALALGFSILSLNVKDIRDWIVMKFKAFFEQVKKLTQT